MKKDTQHQAKKTSALDSRKRNRRVDPDRRGEIRFEPNTDNRRKNTGRRVGDKDVWKAIT